MAILGQDREQLNYKQDQASIELRSFVEATIISESPDIDRITRYAMFWNFYHGKHWRQYNETFLSFNYVKAFVDKINNFLIGKKGCEFTVIPFDGSDLEEDTERAIEGFYGYHWSLNKKATLLHDILQMGSVSGDVWVYVGWAEEPVKYCKMQTLDSRHCFPNFTNGDVNKLESFILRQPLLHNEEGYRVYCTEYTKTTITTWFQKDTGLKSKRLRETETANTYGFIPIVHIKNKPTSDGYYSKSDLADILKINKIYNELSQEIKGIIDYYGTPTTVITGGTVKTLKKGLGNVWSGLPAEANVFNLGLGEDLNATTEFLKTLKTNMHELADVPENTLGKLQAISNTSAAALQITYQPLIQQADLKWLTYGDGIEELNVMIARIVRKFDKQNPLFAKLPAEFEYKYSVEPVFNYGLPQDRAAMLNEANMELTAKIGSRREVMNRLGKKNVPKLLDEIEEDLMNLNAINSAFEGGQGDSLNDQGQQGGGKNPIPENEINTKPGAAKAKPKVVGPTQK